MWVRANWPHVCKCAKYLIGRVKRRRVVSPVVKAREYLTASRSNRNSGPPLVIILQIAAARLANRSSGANHTQACGTAAPGYRVPGEVNVQAASGFPTATSGILSI